MKKIENKQEYFSAVNLLAGINDVLEHLRNHPDHKSVLVSEAITTLLSVEDGVKNAIKNYDEGIRNSVVNLMIPGNILVIHATDGISYDERTYYRFHDPEQTKRRVQRGKIVADVIVVGHGDYGNSISYSEGDILEIEDIIDLTQKFRYELLDDVSKFEAYKKFTETIPE